MSALALDLNRPTEEIDINKIFEQPGVLNTQAKERTPDKSGSSSPLHWMPPSLI